MTTGLVDVAIPIIWPKDAFGAGERETGQSLRTANLLSHDYST